MEPIADMVARPGAAHTVQSLAYSASLSRSAFMARFSEIFGRSPMAILRDLRMRQAALDLTTTTTPVDVVAHNAGYESRSSFVRAFRKAYNVDPSEYRQSVKNGEGDKSICAKHRAPRHLSRQACDFKRACRWRHPFIC